MVIGKLNIKITINRYKSGVVDAYGSPAIELDKFWSKWANVVDKRGSHSVSEGKEQWNYDYKITQRYEASRPTKENDRIVYNGNLLQINSIQIIEESFKMFEVLKCSLTDVN
jgi:SPP1 family predicted phage head-tail adaptor